jgi:lipid-A-disaccharide synthase
MKIFFSVGEPSGDHHAAELIREIRSRVPQAEFYGYGGHEMEKAGCKILFPMANYPLMGIVQILPFIWMFWKLAWRARAIFRSEKPDAVVLVDYPGFNWWMAWYARGAGVKTVYYMPPQLWAWASWRVKRVQRNIDLVLSGLQFETEWYQSKGVDCQFVGNPFFSEVAHKQLDEAFLNQMNSSSKRIVAVLPGSRGSEVKANFPHMLRIMKTLASKHRDIEFRVANYKPNQLELCKQLWVEFDPRLPVQFHTGKLSEIVQSATCCLMVSGSVSLEVLARQCPAVVMYRTGLVFYMAARFFMTCDYASLPNLFVKRPLMPEFAFHDMPDRYERYISDILNHWLSSDRTLALIRDEMHEVCQSHNHDNATEKAATAILNMLDIQERTAPRKLAA